MDSDPVSVVQAAWRWTGCMRSCSGRTLVRRDWRWASLTDATDESLSGNTSTSHEPSPSIRDSGQSVTWPFT